MQKQPSKQVSAYGVQGLGLKRMKWSRRGACYGFPVSQTGHHLRSLLGQGMDVLLVREQQEVLNGIRVRTPVWQFSPNNTFSPVMLNRASGE
jgi:hypothetical protein